VDYDNLELPEKKECKSVAHMMKHFDPNNDIVDKRILYEITGRHAVNERFSDESGSSSDEDNIDKINPNVSMGSLVRSGGRTMSVSGEDEEVIKRKPYSLND